MDDLEGNKSPLNILWATHCHRTAKNGPQSLPHWLCSGTKELGQPGLMLLPGKFGMGQVSGFRSVFSVLCQIKEESRSRTNHP